MNTTTMRTVRRNLTVWTTTALLVAGLSISVDAQTENTCNDVGFTANLTADSSGVWGSVDFDDTESTLTVTVAEGYEVRVCVKAGSVQQGDGPEVTDWLGEGIHVLSHSSEKELSHYAIDFRELPPDDEEPTTTTTTTLITTTTASDEEPTTTTLVDTTTTASETSTTDQTSSTSITAPSTTHGTPSPEDTLPFTGIDDDLPQLIAVAAGLLSLGGITLLTVRKREDT